MGIYSSFQRASMSNSLKKQLRLQKQQVKLQKQSLDASRNDQRSRSEGVTTPPGSSPNAPPPGWYADPEQLGAMRWWDGVAWGTETRSSPTVTTAVQAEAAEQMTVEVVCSGCTQRVRVPAEATRFKCPQCNVVWIFVQCPACKSPLRINQALDAWSCHNCEHHEASSWATTFTFTCQKCDTALRVKKGVESFKCFNCNRIYNRCACGVYSHVLALAGRRWQCHTCQSWNTR